MYIFNYKPPLNCHAGNLIFADSTKLPEPVIISNGSLINNRSDYNSPALSSILWTTESVHCCNTFSIMVAQFPFGRKRDAVLFSMPPCLFLPNRTQKQRSLCHGNAWRAHFKKGEVVLVQQGFNALNLFFIGVAEQNAMMISYWE